MIESTDKGVIYTPDSMYELDWIQVLLLKMAGKTDQLDRLLSAKIKFVEGD